MWRKRLAAAIKRLRLAAYSADKPDETAESTARALWLAVAGQPGHGGHDLPVLTADQVDRLDQYIARRLSGEPLAYIVGHQRFMGLDLVCRQGALIPRRETEILGEAAVSIARRTADVSGSVTVLDLCTGAGNLAVAIAVHEARARVWASDLEADALRVAQENVAHFDLGKRVSLHQGDLFAGIATASPKPPAFDLITCNPPYIPTHKARNMPAEVGGFEPVAAFDGGDFGVSIVLRLLAGAPRYLAPGGWLAFEVGVGQAPLLRKRAARQAGVYEEIREISDAEGTPRVLVMRSAGAA